MASHLYATTCAEIEELPQETDWYASHEESLYAATAKAANHVGALPKKEVAKEMKWQTLRLAVEVADLVNPDLWKIVGDHYERCHDIFDEKRERRPMHNGSQATLELGPLVWETIPCSGGSAPVALGGSAPEPKTVRWYATVGQQIHRQRSGACVGPLVLLKRLRAVVPAPPPAGAGRNHHTDLQDEKSTWFPCMSHALAAGVNAAVKLPMPLGCAPGAPLNLHQLEFPESKLVVLLQHQHVLRRNSMVETWEMKFHGFLPPVCAHAGPEFGMLVADLAHAKGCAETVLRVKLACWGKLPWLLCGLVHHESDVVARIATDCLTLFDNTPDTLKNTHHPLAVVL